MIRVRVVGDGSIADDQSTYGTARLLQALAALQAPGVAVEPRFSRPDATLPSLEEVDVLWLLGYADRDLSAWGERHAEVVAFMDRGHGVLASGDHERRGLSLCGLLPRIQALRHWRLPHAPANGAGSINTLAPTGRRDHPAAKPIFCHRLQPVHPILRHPAGGAVRWLPDHVHEGDLDTAVLEREAAAGLQDWDIQTVAWTCAWENGTQRWVRPTAVLKVAQPPAGHPAGRIVVDSSFHHWVQDDVDQLEGEALAHWQVLLANIVVWLLPATRRATLRATTLEHLERASPLSQVLQLAPGAARRGQLRTVLQQLCERAPLLAALLAEAEEAADSPGVVERLVDRWG